MNKPVEKINLGKFLNDHDDLYNIVWKIYRTEEMLAEEKFRYLYLVSLISSDNIVNQESAQKSIDELTFIKTWLPYMNLSNDLQEEIDKYIKKGLRIAKRDLKTYKERNT